MPSVETFHRKPILLGVILALSLLFSSPWPALAQFGHVVTWEGNTDFFYARLPFEAQSPYSYSQQIYTASQINFEGDICRISFKKAPTSTDTVTQHLRIRMGHVSRTAFSGTGNWELESNLETVFEGDAIFHEGWNEIVLDSPFEYDGVRNLLIAIYNDDTSRLAWQPFVTSENQQGASLTVSSASPINTASPPAGISPNLRDHIKLSFNMCNSEAMTTGVETTCSMLISDPGGDDDYGPNLSVTQTFLSANNSPLVLEFYDFNLGDYDYLYVYDGPSTSSTLLGMYMNSNPPPSRLGGSGQALTLYFTSNPSGGGAGWVASVTCLPCTPVSTASGSPCDGASLHAFCTEDTPDGVSYPSGSGGYPSTFFGQTSVGCLGSITHPAAWYYMRIDNPGNLLLYIEQVDNYGTLRDVDFACWGPFSASTPADFRNNLCCGRYDFYTGASNSHRPSGGNHSTDMGGYPMNNLVDCSYYADPTEWCFIPNAQEGEFYLLLLTNFANADGTISFNSVNTNYTYSTTDCSVLSTAGSNSPLCEGETLFLYCTNTEGGSSVRWRGPNGFTSTSLSPSIPNVTPADSGDYTIAIYLTNGDSVLSTVPVEVNAAPDLTLTAYRDTLCTTDTTRLEASGAQSYQWNPTEATTPVLFVAPEVPTYYQVTGTSNGCSVTAGVMVDPQPLVETLLPAFPDIFCPSELNHTITAQVTNGTPPYSYQWEGPVTPVSGSPETVQTDISAPYLCDSLLSIYLTVTDVNHCMKQDTVFIRIQDLEPPVADDVATRLVLVCENGQYFVPDVMELVGTSASDNCLPDPEITFTQNPAAGTRVTQTTHVLVSAADQCNTRNYGDVEIVVSDPIQISIVQLQHATCNLNNGSIEISITSPVEYVVDWHGIADHTDFSAHNLRPGQYMVSVDNGICPVDFPFTIRNERSIDACLSVMPSPPNFVNDMLRFVDCSQTATSWRWVFGDGSESLEQHPGHQYAEVGSYDVDLYVEDMHGCKDSTSLTLDIKDKTSFFVPNAFSPNGDGVNDLFRPEFVAMDMAAFKMSIYDRWGSLVFYTENADSGWDGTVNGTLPSSTTLFVYLMEYRDHFGKTHVVKGEVVLVR